MHDNQFFIIDWKSNYLGASPSDYSTTEISKAVLKNNYTLQYHIYTLALHRFLQTKIPDYSYSSHFGGVIYLFVRGVSQATKWNNGVYFCKPDLDTISKLDTAFQKGSIVS
jgi:exodeoxyribonuclease V beta subunit